MDFFLPGVTGRDRNDQLGGKYILFYLEIHIEKELIGWEENADSLNYIFCPFLAGSGFVYIS